jgi:hypothetical protein
MLGDKLENVIRSMLTISDFGILDEYLNEYFANTNEEVLTTNYYKSNLFNNYSKFEVWLKDLLNKVRKEKELRILNFGLFETVDNIIIYLAVNNNNDELSDFSFQNENYLCLDIFKNLYLLKEENLNIVLFITLSTTIMFVNTFILVNPDILTKGVKLSVGFDDGDLFHLS